MPRPHLPGMFPQRHRLPPPIVKILPPQRPQRPPRPVIHRQLRVKPHQFPPPPLPPVELAILIPRQRRVKPVHRRQRLPRIDSQIKVIHRPGWPAQSIAGISGPQRRADGQRHRPLQQIIPHRPLPPPYHRRPGALQRLHRPPQIIRGQCSVAIAPGHHLPG